MPIRYWGSVAGGIVITAVLVYSMQWLTAGGDFEVAPPVKEGGIRERVWIPVEPPRTPPPKPKPPLGHQTQPPTLPRVGPPAVHTEDRIVIGPQPPHVGPGERLFPLGGDSVSGAGSGGPWTADDALLPVTRVQPIYPHAALARDLEGWVTIEFTVTERGTVRDARVVASSAREFERAALTAVARFRYRPRSVDGRVVTVQGVRAKIVFKLEN